MSLETKNNIGGPSRELERMLTELRAEDRRWEAACAAKDRAIRRLVTVIFDEWNNLDDTREANAADDEATAALASGGGEGWVPPAVADAVIMALRPFVAFALHIDPDSPDDAELLPDLAVAHFRNAQAALDALEKAGK